MTPGWINFRKEVFKVCDRVLANENFPKHTGGAVVLDGVDCLYTYLAEQPQDSWDYADWMGIRIIPYTVRLDRF